MGEGYQSLIQLYKWQLTSVLPSHWLKGDGNLE